VAGSVRPLAQNPLAVASFKHPKRFSRQAGFQGQSSHLGIFGRLFQIVCFCEQSVAIELVAAVECRQIGESDNGISPVGLGGIECQQAFEHREIPCFILELKAGSPHQAKICFRRLAILCQVLLDKALHVLNQRLVITLQTQTLQQGGAYCRMTTTSLKVLPSHTHSAVRVFFLNGGVDQHFL